MRVLCDNFKFSYVTFGVVVDESSVSSYRDVDVQRCTEMLSIRLFGIISLSMFKKSRFTKSICF